MKTIFVLLTCLGFLLSITSVESAITQGTFANFAPQTNPFPQIANDSNGVSYFAVKESETSIKMFTFDGTSWAEQTSVTVAALKTADGGVGGLEIIAFSDYISIATDHNNKLHLIARFRRSNNDAGLFYALYSGGSWTYEIIASSGTERYYEIKLAVDDNNFPHLTYTFDDSSTPTETHAVKHTHRKTGSWSAPVDVFSWTGSVNTNWHDLHVRNLYYINNTLYCYYAYDDNNSTVTPNIYLNTYNNSTDTWGTNTIVFNGVSDAESYQIFGQYEENGDSYLAYYGDYAEEFYFSINGAAPTAMPSKNTRYDFPYDMMTDGNGNYYVLMDSYDSGAGTDVNMYMRAYNGTAWVTCDNVASLSYDYNNVDYAQYTLRPDGKIIVVHIDYVTVSPYGAGSWFVGDVTDFLPSNCFTPASAVTPPTLGNTVAVSNITATSATSGGTITNDNGDAVTVSGVCWNTATAPTTANSKSTDGDNSGAFVSNLSGLSSNTLYYVRSYAENAGGPGYGSEVTFRTLAIVPNAPTVNNASATSLDVTLDVNGNNAATNFAIQETNSGNYVQANGSLGASPVWQNNSTWGTVTVTGLTRYTEYIFQAKARNSDNVETAFGTTQAGTTLQTVPTLTTTAYSILSANSASSGGEITDDGGAAITVRGVCWNTTGTPDINDDKTTDGTGAGSFTSDITGLTPNTLYYVRSYATNSVGTTYGNQIQFTTLNISVTIINVIKNTDTEYELTAEITNPSVDPILAKGYVWGTSQNPTTASNSGSTSNGTGDASFTDNATITIGPGYYVRAYITTAGGTTYSEAVHFGVVPTLPEWGLIFLAAGFVLGGGWFAFKRIL